MTGKIGVLTGGGDCPGLNAAIRAVVRSGIASGLKVIGIRNGWQGLITNDTVPLSDHAISGIISWGGTILGSSRTDPLKNSDDIKSLKRTIRYAGHRCPRGYRRRWHTPRRTRSIIPGRPSGGDPQDNR